MARKTKAKTQEAQEPEFDIFQDDNLADLSTLQRAALTAFIKSNGRITTTCKEAKITRATWYYWKKSDERFRQVLAEIDEFFTDELESAAHSFAMAGDATLIKFLLEAKRRGQFDGAYVKQERALEKGLQPPGTSTTPIYVELVRGRGPEETEPEGE
jgi:hypothetical protein